jgi:catechol 2,3-dioxygenase-like lactoylglutathione lyase family enzyme
MAVSDSAVLHHTSLLVRDLDAAATRLAAALGVRWNCWTIAPEHCFVHGQPSPFTFRAAFADVGGTNLELIAPHSGRSVYDEHLDRHGEGLHHTCLAYADLDTMRAAKADLLRQGFRVVQHGYTEGFFEFCYVQLTEPAMLLELLFIKELPPPEKTIG